MSKRGVLLFLLSLLVGVVVGELGRSRAPLAAQDLLASSPREARPPARRWQLDDFLEAIRQQPISTALPEQDRCAAALSLWSEEELRSALDECIYTPKGQLSVVSMYLRKELLKAWIARNPDAVLEWFDALDPPTLRSRVADQVAWLWPKGKAEEGFAYFLANREVFREGSTYFQDLILQARVKEGPGAVYATLKQFRDEGLTGFGRDLKLPAGFDFASLLERDFDALAGKGDPVGEHELGAAQRFWFHAWYSQDHEQAFDWLLHEKGAAGLATLLDRSSERNEESAWLPGKIATLPEDQQNEFMEATREQWLQDMQSLKVFATASKDPGLQDRAQRLAVEGVVYGNTEHSLEVIAMNPDVERRLSILGESPIGAAPRKPHASFDGGTAKYLRETLSGWGVESGRIESIIARFAQYEPPTQ